MQILLDKLKNLYNSLKYEIIVFNQNELASPKLEKYLALFVFFLLLLYILLNNYILVSIQNIFLIIILILSNVLLFFNIKREIKNIIIYYNTRKPFMKNKNYSLFQ